MLAPHPGARQAFAALAALDTAGRIAGRQQPGYSLRSQLADSSCLQVTLRAGAALPLQPPPGKAHRPAAGVDGGRGPAPTAPSPSRAATRFRT